MVLHAFQFFWKVHGNDGMMVMMVVCYKTYGLNFLAKILQTLNPYHSMLNYYATENTDFLYFCMKSSCPFKLHLTRNYLHFPSLLFTLLSMVLM